MIAIHLFQWFYAVSTTVGTATTTEKSTAKTYATSPTPGNLFLDDSQIENWTVHVWKYKL